MDPVSEFVSLLEEVAPVLGRESGLKLLEEKQAAAPPIPLDLHVTQQKEIGLWKTWKDNGMKHEDVRPLLSSLRPLINKEANRWAIQRDIPPAAIRAEFTNHAVKALETYDPNRSALNTHIRNYMKKAQRFVTTYQNVARIPETRIYNIGKFNTAQQNLEEQFGRSATQLELADHLQWSPRTVATFQKEQRKGLLSSKAPGGEDPTVFIPSAHKEILRLLPYDLDPDERAVFEHLYGINGKARLTPGEIAVKLNMSAPKVSRIKLDIAKKFKSYI